MCRQDSRVRMSAEEESAAEESLSIYCKPVELYNILQRRAIRNPSFLQRCLRYKIEAMHKKRIQMKISVPGTVNESLQTQNLFPLFIFLARLVSDVADAEYSAVYRFSRVCILTNPTGVERSTQIQAANVILPEINKLAMEAKSGSLAILLVSWVGAQNPLLGINITKGSLDITSFLSTVGGYCLWGKLPFESLYMSWENSPNFSLGQRAEIISTVNMHSCFLKFSCLNEDKCISIQLPYNPETLSTSQQVQVTISAEEIGAQEKSPYNSYLCSDAPSSLSHIIRLRAGNVIFNYRYYDNKLQRTEVTEDFSCPFCLVKCASFKGLRFHLSSSHDLFNFEFWVTEEYQAVNVSVKSDTWRSEVVADGVDPKQQTFFFCSKPLRRRRPKNLVQSAKHVHPLALESDLPSEVCELLDKADDAYSSQGDKARFSGISNAVPQSHVDPDCVQSILGNNLVPPTMLQFAKTRGRPQHHHHQHHPHSPLGVNVPSFFPFQGRVSISSSDSDEQANWCDSPPLSSPRGGSTAGVSFVGANYNSTVTALSEDNERLRRSNSMLMSELAHMRKLYNDIIYFVQNHVKPVAPSNSYPSSLHLCNPPAATATPITTNSPMVQKPLNQILGYYPTNPKQAPYSTHAINSPSSTTSKSSVTILEEPNSNSCKTKLFGVPLQSKKRLHPEYGANPTNMETSIKARLVLEKDDLGLNLMPPSAC